MSTQLSSHPPLKNRQNRLSFAKFLEVKMPTSPCQTLPMPRAKERRTSIDEDHLKNRTPLLLPRLEKKERPDVDRMTRYWDNLSQVYLTRSPLNELDRRATRHNRITIEGQPELKSGEITEPSIELRRAVRQGWLDLQHLRGVGYAQNFHISNTPLLL